MEYATFLKNDCVEWIREWFKKNGDGCNAVVGISGGKDSSVVAALCVEALGADRVIGVMMPNGIQWDLDVSKKVISHLGIKSVYVNIGEAVFALTAEIENDKTFGMSEQANINLPARIRMSTLYAVSQSLNGRVANTCNLSEDYVGYATRYGDGAGDFSPLSEITVTHVKQIGKVLGLPDEFIYKTPTDGLCGKTDEENLGFTYEQLDDYIMYGKCDDENLKAKIDTMHEKNLFKLKYMDVFKPSVFSCVE